MAGNTAEAILKANVSNFLKGMDEARRAAKQMKDETSRMEQVGGMLSNIGKGLMIGVTTPLLGIGAASVKAGKEFESQMSRVKAISGATGGDFEKLQKVAMDLGASTQYSATQVAEGMENMASAGFTTDEIINAMAGTLDLAAVSGGDLDLASAAVATSLRQFGLDASEAGRVADVFARAAADSNAEADSMAEAMKYAAPVASTLGISIEETAAAIGIMSNAGIMGSQAGTALRGAFTKLAKPTSEASDLMEDLGIEIFDANGVMLPMEQVIANLSGAFGGLTEEQKVAAATTLFGQQSMTGMLALIDAGSGQFGEFTNSLENSEGAAREMAETIMDNLQGSILEMQSAMEGAAINIYNLVAPAFREIVDRITDLITKFNELTPEQQANILKWAGILAAVGPVLLIIGKLVGVVSVVIGFISKLTFAFSAVAGGAATLGEAILFIVSPAGLVVAGILALIAAGVLLWQNWDTVVAWAKKLWEGIQNVWNSIKEATVALKDGVVAAWDGLKVSVSNTVNALKEGVVNTINNLKEGAVNGFNTLKDSVINTVNNLKQGAVDAFNNLKDSASNAIRNMKDNIVNFFTNAKNDATNKANEMKNNAVNAATNMASTIGTKVREIPGKIRQAFQDAVNAAKNFVGEAIQAGKDFIGGFISGIGDAAGRLVDKAKGAVQGALDGAKRLLGIHSPAKKTAYQGKMMMAGYTQGIDRNKRNVLKSMDSVMDGVLKTYDSGVFDFEDLGDLNNRTSSRVEHIVQDNLGSRKPQVVYLQMGRQTYRAYVDDISGQQDREARLERVYG